MSEERTQILNDLFYKAEEYIHYNISEYKEYHDYLLELINNIDCVESDIKPLLVNWEYKNKVYKTLNINSITIPYNGNMIANVLYGLIIRIFGRHDYNPHPITLHIDYTNNDDVYLDYFTHLESIDNFFHKKCIHIYNYTEFSDEIYNYFVQNNYELIYEVNSLDNLVKSNSVRINVNDENINILEDLISKSIENKCKTIYVMNNCSDATNKNSFRNNIDDYIFKYNTLEYSIIIEDYIPGQHLNVSDEYVSLKSNYINFEQFSKDYYITNINQLKMSLIDKTYLHNKCIDCSEKILCMLGASTDYCEYKIF